MSKRELGEDDYSDLFQVRSAALDQSLPEEFYEWLDVPFSEKGEAKALGAWWDPDAKKWYAPYPIEGLKRWTVRPRQWLDVPFSEKDEAKALGAKWDPDETRWYMPRSAEEALAKWTALPDLPELLAGEDRSFGSGLFVDLVPQSCWFTNVRTCVSERDWERVRRMVIKRAGKRCEACGSDGKKIVPSADDEDSGIPSDMTFSSLEVQTSLQVHERWQFRGKTQTLRRLVALCEDCHESTHLGRATSLGRRVEALGHLQIVRKESDSATAKHVKKAYADWSKRNKGKWKLDLSVLESAGVELKRPPSPKDRAEFAENGLESDFRRYMAEQVVPQDQIDRCAKGLKGLIRSGLLGTSDGPPSTNKEVAWIRADPEGSPPKQTTGLSGKWMWFSTKTKVDADWKRIAEETEKGLLGSGAKVSTLLGEEGPHGSPNRRVLMVYTPDRTDLKDVRRVLRALRTLGFSGMLTYKEDSVTLNGTYGGCELFRSLNGSLDMERRRSPTPITPEAEKAARFFNKVSKVCKPLRRKRSK